MEESLAFIHITQAYPQKGSLVQPILHGDLRFKVHLLLGCAFFHVILGFVEK